VCVKAFVLTESGAPPELRDDHPAPTPAADELLVRVLASSINPVDNAIAAGMLEGMVEHEYPVVLGRDYAGVVEEAASGVTGYAPGEEVFGFVPYANPTVHDGSWTELIVVPEGGFVGRIPSGIDRAAAGVTPLAGISAMTSVDALELAEGDVVLIAGAAGGVGSFAVQLAARAGATVVAPGLREDEDYLRDLGATDLLDRGADVPAAVRERYPDGIDALLDLVSYSPDEFDAYAALLRDGGRGASTISAAGNGSGRTNAMAVPSHENIERLAGLLADGTLKVPVQHRYPLSEAGEGLRALIGTHTQGKLAIDVA
jgi:NADPH:quinone reductase